MKRDRNSLLVHSEKSEETVNRPPAGRVRGQFRGPAAQGAAGDLRGIKEASAVRLGDGSKKHALGDTCDEIAHGIDAVEGGQVEPVGLCGSMAEKSSPLPLARACWWARSQASSSGRRRGWSEKAN